MTQKQCPYCGELFIPIRDGNFVCSKKACQRRRIAATNRRTRKRQRERAEPVTRPCFHCGEMFQPGTKTYFCDKPECQAKKMELRSRGVAVRDLLAPKPEWNNRRCLSCNRKLWGPWRYHCPDCLPSVTDAAGEIDGDFLYF